MADLNYSGYSKEIETALLELQKHIDAANVKIGHIDKQLSEKIDFEIRNIGFIIPKLANSTNRSEAIRLRFMAVSSISVCGALLAEAASKGILKEQEFIKILKGAFALSSFKTLMSIPGVEPLAQILTALK